MASRRARRRCRRRRPGSPAAAIIAVVSCTVVVLPLVPVTADPLGAASPTLSRSRQASSMSPQTGDAVPVRPRATSGWSGWKPGETTTSSGSKSTSSPAAAPSRSSHDQPSADHRQQVRGAASSAAAGQHEHVGAELGERVRDGESGDAEAQNGDPEPAPVRVPARRGRRGDHGRPSADPRGRSTRGRRRRRPAETNRPEMSQNRTTIVTSAQPFISK